MAGVSATPAEQGGGAGPPRRGPDGLAGYDRAVAAYLDYLTVERGLAAATIRAYRGDLADLRRDLETRPGPRWDRSADAAVAYLASHARRGGSGDRGLAPTSLRRRAAAIKGFYRFAFGEGLIDVDVASHLDLPRQSRRLPDTLTVAEVERLLEAAAERGVRDRTLLEVLYAAGLRVSEAIGLDREDVSLDGAFVRVIGKGDRERLVPVGDEASTGWRPGSTASDRPSSPRIMSRRSAGTVVPGRPGTPPRPPAGVGRRPRGGRTGRPRWTGQPAHPAPLVRDTSARGRGGPARRPGVARTCEYLHDPAVHAPHR